MVWAGINRLLLSEQLHIQKKIEMYICSKLHMCIHLHTFITFAHLLSKSCKRASSQCVKTGPGCSVTVLSLAGRGRSRALPLSSFQVLWTILSMLSWMSDSFFRTSLTLASLNSTHTNSESWKVKKKHIYLKKIISFRKCLILNLEF